MNQIIFCPFNKSLIDQYTLLIKSCSVLPWMRNISDISCRENKKTRIFMFKNFFFFENRAVHEIMWKNVVELDRPQRPLWRMHTACWIPKATNRLGIRNTYCFSTATMVERTRLEVTLHVHCLCCCILTKLPLWWHFNKLKHVARWNVKKCQQIKNCVREGNSANCQFIEHWCPPAIRNYFCGTRLLSVPSTFRGSYNLVWILSLQRL
jgi:hypothetical protein